MWTTDEREGPSNQEQLPAISDFILTEGMLIIKKGAKPSPSNGLPVADLKVTTRLSE